MGIPKDKLAHFVVGAITSGVTVGFGQWLGYGGTDAATLGLCAAGLAGMARELWQKQTGSGVADMSDFLVTLAGGALVSVVVGAVLSGGAA